MRTRGSGRTVRRALPLALVPLALALAAPTAWAARPSDTVLPPTGGHCAATPNLLKTRPTTTQLPYGMTMRVWDTGPITPSRAIRVVVITIPRSSPVGFRALASPNLTTTQTTSQQVAQHRDVLVAVNAAVFNLSVAGIPEGPQIIDGQVAKATSAWQDSINVGTDGKATPGTVALRTHWTAPRGAPTVGSVNWQNLTSGINVYTAAWGPRAHPSGGREVWITGTVTPDLGNHTTTLTGRVSRIISSGLGHRPPANTWVLTTSYGNTGMLNAFRTGLPVQLTLGYQAIDRLGTTLGGTLGAVGRGGVYIWKGVNRAGCGARDETLRPRTFIGWRTTSRQSDAAQTDAFIMTVQGRNDGGSRYGGASVHQATDFMLQLGAGRAVGFDSGGSTTMVIRPKIGGSLIHIDRANPRDSQRSIVNVLTIAPRITD